MNNTVPGPQSSRLSYHRHYLLPQAKRTMSNRIRKNHLFEQSLPPTPNIIQGLVFGRIRFNSLAQSIHQTLKNWNPKFRLNKYRISPCHFINLNQNVSSLHGFGVEITTLSPIKISYNVKFLYFTEVFNPMG